MAVESHTQPLNGAKPNGISNGHQATNMNAGGLEPIAIVGAGCRMPGGASDPQKLWKLLKEKRSAWSPFPESRFSRAGFHNTTGKSNMGTTYTAGGHFLENDISAFDTAVFSIPPKEIITMDPQQRLLLEVAYETFENAGFSISDLSDSKTGVYVGQWTSDYHDMLTRDLDHSPVYLPLGTGPAIASNRLSYYFNLHGPSFTLDTGCSASLVALHQAVQGLRTGDAEQSFVAGVNLTLDPHRFTYLSNVSMFSQEGKSFPFDGRANGYGRGEGCSGVLLMPLSRALQQGRTIRAVIRNSACNQDGRTNGITVPSATAQMDAIRKAYQDASLDLYADYVEAHGTGTKVGDPIEAKAISATLGINRSPSSPLPIGSIKGNVGHSESASGLMGLVKAVLMLEKNEIPPQLNSEERNPAVPLNKLNLRINLEAEPCQLNRVSVNSFGYGGTNAHVILDSASSVSNLSCNGYSLNGANGSNGVNGSSDSASSSPSFPAVVPFDDKRRLFVLSAATEKSCQAAAENLANYLDQKSLLGENDNQLLDQLAYTLSRRTGFSHRAGFIASSLDDLKAQLQDAAAQPVPAQVDQTNHRIAFVFSGQGAQYPLMGQELLGKWAPFRKSLDRATACLIKCGATWNLIDEICKPSETSRITEPELAQPLTTAIQMALVDLLRELDLLPTVVAGHSSGEIAAAYCADIINFEDAISVAYHRGRLSTSLAQKKENVTGAMLAVGESPSVVDEALEKLEDSVRSRLRLACFNSPSSVTVSGDEDAIDLLHLQLDEQRIFNRKLRTGGVAYHSHQMKLIGEEYREALSGIQASKPPGSVTMISSLTGEEVGAGLIDRDYWVRNMLSPVRFADAITVMLNSKSRAKKPSLMIELGPHFQLVGPVKQTLRALGSGASKIQCTGTLKRGEDAEVRILDTLRYLWANSVPVNFNLANARFSTKQLNLLIDLPPYPFDHSRTFWHESLVSKAYRQRKNLPHELIGNMDYVQNPNEPRWRVVLQVDKMPWLKGHQVQGDTVFPAAGFITMALKAAEQEVSQVQDTTQVSIKQFQLRNICLEKALVLKSGQEDLEIYITFKAQTISARKSSGIWKEFRVYSVAGHGKWSEHCHGLIHAVVEDTPSPMIANMDQASFDEGKAINPKKFYFLSKDAGLNWDDPFDVVTGLKVTKDGAVATVSTSDEVKELSHIPDYILHPAILDGCLFHGIFAIQLFEHNAKTAWIPTFIKTLNISVPAKGQQYRNLSCYSKKASNGTFNFEAFHKDTSDAPIMQSQGLVFTKLPGLNNGDGENRQFCHTIEEVAYIPTVSENWLQENCRSKVETMSLTDRLRALDALALSYLKPVIQKMSRDEIPDNHLRYWYDWMKTHENKEYDDEDLRTALANPEWGGEEVRRLGPHLEEVLRGSLHSLSLLTKDGLLDGVYSTEAFDRCYRQLGPYCKELGLFNPTMKVLEIGGGTASISRPVLESLKLKERVLVSKYDFTDISSGFFPQAQEKLAEFEDVMNYQALNIENDPVEQGFEEHTYDLVIAANVIHATSSIDKCLQHIRRLLKPGGKFILMEAITDIIHISLVFGSLPGWWAGYDEGRTHTPLLTPEAWCSKFAKHGFTQNPPSIQDYDGDDGAAQYVFIATAEEEPSEAPAPAINAVTSSVDDSESVEFVKQLKLQFLESQVNFQTLSRPIDNLDVTIILPAVSNYAPEGNTFEELRSWITSSKVVVLAYCSKRKSPDHIHNGDWVVGFCRTVRQEYPGVRILTLDLDSELSSSSNLDAIRAIMSSPSADPTTSTLEYDTEFIVRNGDMYVPRVLHVSPMSEHIHQSHGHLDTVQDQFSGDRSLIAEVGTPGLVDTIQWTDDPSTSEQLDPDFIRFKLCAAGINFKEVLIASGQLEGINQMTNEASGIVIEVGENMKHRFSPGDRVVSGRTLSYSNYPACHGDFCIRIPDDMDFDTAASFSVVWMTSYRGLIDCANLQKGEKVLIHLAAGGVGQAAVMIAQHIGAEVFATCGTQEKRDVLRNTFGIPDDHIFSSRNAEFSDEIMRYTSGKGVDVVLNSLSGELLRASCNVLAPMGRFIEIGRKDLMEDSLLPMEFFLENISFTYIEFNKFLLSRHPRLQPLIHSALELYQSTMASKKSSLTKMPISDISKAFRFLQTGKHIGKVILTVEQDQMVKTVRPMPKLPVLKEDSTYIIAGGLGGFGKMVVTWFAERGARNIVILSRSGAADDDSKAFLEKLQSEGVNVVSKRCDISSESVLKQTISEIQTTMPPIRGLIQSAMVLRDSVYGEMTASQWSEAMAPKLSGTWNLHSLLPADMDFFIALSSGVSVVGNLGQCNYAAGCSFQDGLMRYRESQGLAGHSVNLGVVSEAGFVSENPEVAMNLRRHGLGTVSVSEVLMHLDQILLKQGTSLPCQSVLGLIPAGNELGLGPSKWMDQKMFAPIRNQSRSLASHSAGDSNAISALCHATTLDDAVSAAARAIMDQLSKLLGISSETMNPAMSLNSYAIESLIAVELRNFIGVSLKATVSLLFLRGSGTITELAQLVVKESKLVSSSLKSA